MTIFDPSKFRRSLTKSLDTISLGFSDPTTWIGTGSYALNYLISGSFYRGVPLGRVTMVAGESGSGKSLVVSGNLVREAQRQGIFTIIFDSEEALDERWLHNLGVDTSEEKLLRIRVAMIDDVAKIISDFVKEYRAEWIDKPIDQRPKVLMVIDSLGMLLTPTDQAQFQGGELKGDLGRKPKALNALIRNCVSMFGELEIGLVATNHQYASHNQYDPTPIIAGGAGFTYAASQVVLLQKFKLKEDEEGQKVSETRGIRAKATIFKTRYAKPFESTEIRIPYDTGMDPYSGIFDLFMDRGYLLKEGNRYIYNSIDGTSIKMFQKEYNRNDDGILDKMMREHDEHPVTLARIAKSREWVTGTDTDNKENETTLVE